MAEQMVVERVARAICKADALAPDANAPIYIGVKAAKAWEARLPMARAAIEAMREPSAIMCVRMYHEFCGSCGTSEELMGNAWRAAIDAALKP